MATDYISNTYNLAFDNQDNLYVSGYFGLTNSTTNSGRSLVNDKDTQGNPIYYSNVAKYDGKKWTNLNGGLKNIYPDIEVDGNNIYFISSRDKTKKWDGHRFTDIDLNASYIYDISIDRKGSLVAIGNFKHAAESATDKDKVAEWKRD